MAKRRVSRYVFEPGISKDSNLFPNAYNLIIANKDYLLAELVAYINYAIDEGLSPYDGYTYDSNKCIRDFGYIIDAIAHDLRYGGNVQIRQIAEYFWIDGVLQLAPQHVAGELFAFEYTRNLINNFIFTNTAVTPARQSAVAQVFVNGSNAESGASTRNTALWQVIYGVIQNGPDTIPAKTPGVSSIRMPEGVDISRILLITDPKNGNVLYNFADPSNTLQLISKKGVSSGDGKPLSDLDFPKWYQTSDTVTTLFLSADTSSLVATDDIQIFVEDEVQTIRPWLFGTDAIERMRVATPQAMLDADFEYGLQPTKWQAISTQLGYPSIYEVPGTDTVVTNVITDASETTQFFGSSIITVTTVGPHGFAVGTPIIIKGLATDISGFSRAEGSFLVNSVPTPTTFTYYATAKVGDAAGEVLYTSFVLLRQGGFYTGSAIGTPTFDLVSNGSSASIVTSLLTPAGASNIAFTGTAPTTGAPLSGSPNIVSGTQVTGVVGSGEVSTNVKNDTIPSQTFINLANTGGVQAGMAVENEAGTAVFVTSVDGNRVNLDGQLGRTLIGADGSSTNIAGTNIESIGVGAIFDVSRSGGTYAVSNSDDSSSNGQNYTLGDQVVIAGDDLGGATPDNDIIVTITEVASGGEIVSFDISGTSISGGATYTEVSQTVSSGVGLNATITVVRQGGTGLYDITLVSGGTGHAPGDLLTFAGTSFGGASPDNDIVIQVNGVAFGTNAVVDFQILQGTGVTGDAAYTGVVGTNRAPTGTNARFTVTRTDGNYSLTVTTAGTGYLSGNRLSVAGSALAGTSPLNDALITVTTVNESGGITEASITGTPKSGAAFSVFTTLSISEPLDDAISSGTTLTTGALATIEVEFTSNHGLVPGSAILTNITSFPPPAFESTLEALPSSGSWSSVAFLGSRFVAVRSGSNATAFSIDGQSWTAAGNLPASATWTSIAAGIYDGTSVWIAVRNGSNSAARSTDGGSNWSSVTLPTVTNTNWTSVTYFDGVFVAVRSGSTGAAYSTNGGVSWSTGTLPGTSTWSDVVGGTIGTVSYFVAIASGGTAAAYSFDNGATWSASTLPSSSTWSAIAYGNSKFVAIASGTANAAISTDGTTWTAATMPASSTWNDITFGDDVFVAVAQNTNIAATSFTGVTGSWTSRTLASTAAWDGIAYGNYSGLGIFVVVGNNTTVNYIQLTSAKHQLASGSFIVTSVPTPTVIRFPAKTIGTINIDEQAITGEVYSRPEAFFVHRPFDGGVQLGTGGPQHGAQAIRQSKKYIRYQSGKGIMYTTGALFAPSYDLLSASSNGLAANSIITFATDDTDHGLQPGGVVEIIGMNSTEYNGTYTVESIRDSRTFRVRANNALNTTTPSLGNEAKVVVRGWHGAVVRTGAFDDQNGLFFQYDGTTMSLGKRSSTFQLIGQVAVDANSNAVTGTNTKFQDQLKVGDRVVLRGMTHTITSIASQTALTFSPDFRGVNNISGAKMCLIEDLIIPQSQWNIDTCDGNGPSGYIFDPGRMQMIGIQYSWYAAGFVEWMIRGSDGKFIFLHRLRNSNVNTEAYMRTANLPVRYEVENIGARGRLYSTIDANAQSLTLYDASTFPNSGTLYIDNELISYSGKSGRTLTGLTRFASFSNFSQGANRVYTAGAEASHTAKVGVRLVSNTITPAISHWGSALLTDGLFDEDRGYLFSYAATSINITTTKTTAFLIRLAPSVSNALTGDLGERDLLNRAQLLLKEISITADSVTGGGGIVVEGVLNPQNYPTNPANIQWGSINTVAAGGQPSFAQIAPGGTVDWASGATQTTRNAQTATGTTVNRRNFLYFKATSWEASGATIGTEVSSPSNFPAGTRVTNIFGPANYRGGSPGNEYLVYFNQSSIASIAGDTNIAFLFGQPPFALPGETVFSFISNPGERATLDLAELKELTTTALGGRGAFPNGPDVLAINVYKVAGTATSGNIILRWTEAQA
jgi:hypothetical protein